MRGHGLGRWLLDEALAFCGEMQYEKVFLWTASELLAAGRLYRRAGFELTEESTHETWGCKVTEQRYELTVASPYKNSQNRHASSDRITRRPIE